MILEVGDEPEGRSRSLLDAKEGENFGKEKVVRIREGPNSLWIAPLVILAP